ncbi:MAG: hypothetical protein GKS07_09135 [Nitrosopumilus sp.]|nr:MAG: hypothetical protein GKS07_09135 [Nitrosopumilus sp.]
MKIIQFAIISVVLFSVVLGIIFVSTSGYMIQNSFLYANLNLLDGYWFTTATPTPTPSEIKFLDDGTFVVTVRNEEGDVNETYVGTYELDMDNRTLKMDLNSTVVKLSLYDVQRDSFSGSSAKHDLLMSFQRRF